MLKEVIPASARKKVYAVVAVIGFALGGIQVGYAAAEVGQPVWLVVAFAVYGFVAAGTGAAAAGNTPRPVVDDPMFEDLADDDTYDDRPDPVNFPDEGPRHLAE